MKKCLVRFIDGTNVIMPEEYLRNRFDIERLYGNPSPHYLLKEIIQIDNDLSGEKEYLEKLVARDEEEYKKLAEINYNQQLKIEELEHTVDYLTDVLARTKRMLDEKEQISEELHDKCVRLKDSLRELEKWIMN